MGLRPIHFEIHADDVNRAVAFYRDALGWSFEDWSGYAGVPYFGATTGDEALGINGAIMERAGDEAPPAPDGGGCGAFNRIYGSVLTVGADDFDAAADRIIAAGGTVALPKQALPGMAWQGYFLDTEGNVFGLHQPDMNAK
ncbi:MAG TPA: VOC family protein [Propionibacterium sp.]|jgi:predicted enzyme related to lactoylglutathione lyase|nr:VOC family protein [Propionibacterium sp.]